MNKRILLVGVCFIFICSVGCEAQKQMRTMREESKSVMLTLADKIDIDQGNMSAGGSVHNPKYYFKGFVGTGFLAEGEVGVIGVDGDVRMMGGGSGKPGADPELRKMVYDTMSRADIGAEQRKSLAAQGIANWWAKKQADAAIKPKPATQEAQ
jgi:hypothetical protein